MLHLYAIHNRMPLCIKHIDSLSRLNCILSCLDISPLVLCIDHILCTSLASSFDLRKHSLVLGNSLRSECPCSKVYRLQPMDCRFYCYHHTIQCYSHFSMCISSCKLHSTLGSLTCTQCMCPNKAPSNQVCAHIFCIQECLGIRYNI